MSKESFPTISILGALFVGLKLTNQIDWSWWLVLLPYWLTLALFAVMLLANLITTKEVANRSSPLPLTFLGFLFIWLKLTGHIDWSWWLVILPFCGGFVVLAFMLLVIGVAALITKHETKGKV